MNRIHSQSIRVIDVYQEGGLPEVWARLRERISPPGELSMAQLLSPNNFVTDSPANALIQLAVGSKLEPPSEYDAEQWTSEWYNAFPSTKVEVDASRPARFAVEQNTSHLLYLLTRWRKPSCVFETGIARGASSLIFLTAMQKNGEGVLHSVDVDNDVGQLVPQSLRSNWHIHILPKSNVKRAFTSIMNEIPLPQLFFHDSSHRYRWMRFELEQMISCAGESAIIGADDVHEHTAFFDATTEIEQRVVLLDKRKASGFAAT